MKRWILFLALFAIGLGVLVWIDRGTRREAPPIEPVTPAGVQKGPGELTEVPLGNDQTAAVAVGGSFTSGKFDEATGKPLYRITARNAESIGEGVYRFDRLIGRFFVPGTDILRLEVHADTARGKLNTLGGGEDPTQPAIGFDLKYPMEMDGVVATLHEGSPLVPLTFRVAHANGIFADQKVSSSDPVKITGEGLTADGVGLDYDGVAGELRLRRDTHVDMTLEDGSVAKLSAAGGLTFTNLEKPDLGATRVVAREKAHLVFQGERPFTLDADEVTLDALVIRAEGEKTRVQPIEVDAKGSVVVQPEEGKFLGDAARLVLDVQGRPQSAVLTGNPRVDLVLRDLDPAVVPGEVVPSSGDLPVHVAGVGPLELQLGTEPSFDFLGPATLTLPSLDLTMTAADKLSGKRVGEGAFGLDAIGGVEARSEGSTLTADALRIERTLAADGQVAASMVAEGPTHATGTLDDGGTFDLTAAGGLEYVRLEDSFQVPVARGVELVVTGPRPLTARADEVRDLDGTRRSFTGSGQVSFENAEGKGRGQRVFVHGEDSLELVGSPDAPAHVDFEQGWLEARTIRYEGTQLRAEGDAKAKVGLEGAAYDLASRWITLERTPVEGGEDLVLEAGGDVDLTIEDETRRLGLTSQYVKARAFSPGKLESLENRGLVATGDIHFQITGDGEHEGSGERLVIEPDRSGRLYPAEGRRVQLAGRLPKDDLSFELSAGVVRFTPETLSADDPDIEIQGVEVPVGKGSDVTAKSPLRAIAGAMSVDTESILFTDGVYMGQSATPETTWSLDGEKLVMVGAKVVTDEEPRGHFKVTRMVAWDGFHGRFGEDVRASGDVLLLDREHDRMVLRGEPGELRRGGLAWAAPWIEIDLATGYLRATSGSLRSVPDERASAQDKPYREFELRYASVEPVHGIDARMQVFREPSFIDNGGEREVRASWGLFWLDEQRLERATTELLSPPDSPLGEIPEETSPRRTQSKFFRRLEESGITEWVREAYLEGNIEVIEHGERRIRADSLYMDLVDGHGWVRDVDFTLDMPFRSRARHLKLHADWLRYSRDGSARAEHAVATSCEFDEPHYEVTLGDLRMTPRLSKKAQRAIDAGRQEGIDETDGYQIQTENNGVRIGRGPQLPMPKFGFPTDKNFKILSDEFTMFGISRPFSVGSDAKFGTFIGISFDLPLGWVSKMLHRLLSGPSMGFDAPEWPEGHNSPDIDYLSSRGLLLGWRNTIKQEGVYELSTRFDFINDSGEDRGLVRVPEDERSTLRGWLRSHGRRMVTDTEWYDFVLTTQTDPGVQAEFFEGEFQRWEERETYLHWRKADGLDYSRATIETQLDDHRTEVVEEPSAGYTRARASIGRLFGKELVYASDSTIARLRRIEGDGRYEAPFADGFGEVEVHRLDSTHRLELPISLDAMDARLIPFVEARATAWDRGATHRKAPLRFAVLAGAELSTTYWRMYSHGDLHTLTPTIGVHSELAIDQSGPIPATFDEVEAPLDGQFVDLGLRSRWVKPRDPLTPEEDERFLDIELRQTYADGLSGGRQDGWQPLRVNAQWLTEVFDVPFGVTHDGRYDLDPAQTVYSRTFVGIRPVNDVEIEASYHSARDLSDVRLYNAWRLAVRYDFSEKWQLEARETFSTLSGSQLDSGFLVRRIGHDFVIELEYGFVAGEGGGSIGFSIEPILTYRESRIGLLNRWQEQGN